MTEALSKIEQIALRQKPLVKQLMQFSFPKVVLPLAGLLVQPENHTATHRVEALIHLAAFACNGKRSPTPRQLNAWVNDEIYNDVITENEQPIRDVFVSNVVASFGNARLFNGSWQNNGDYVQTCIWAIFNSGDETWNKEVIENVNAILRLSEAVAERSGVARYLRTFGEPGDSISIDTSEIAEMSMPLSFSMDELESMDVPPRALDPFILKREHTDLVFEQSIGHSEIERRPLVKFEDRIIVALPTAIGVAIRRLIVDRFYVAGGLKMLETNLHRIQFTEVFHSSRAEWEIEYVEMFNCTPDSDVQEFHGKFDEGGHVYFLFLPDDLKEASECGLTSVHKPGETILKKIHNKVLAISRNPEFQRGLIVLVYGGIGRTVLPFVENVPQDWHVLSLSAPDFILLGGEPQFTAMRAWKLLQQFSDLEKIGVKYVGSRNFFGLMAFAIHGNFELVPTNMNLGSIYIHSDLLLPLRYSSRASFDKHAVIAPNGKEWIVVQRNCKGEFIDSSIGNSLYYSIHHIVDGEFLACIEVSSHLWWISHKNPPKNSWHRSIVSNMLTTTCTWLERLVPSLEELLCTTLRPSITYEFRFPNIEKFDQTVIQTNVQLAAPSIKIESDKIVISCTHAFLRSLLFADNSSDQWLILSLVRGAYLFCQTEVVSHAKLMELIRTVVGPTDNARFFQMTPSETPHDIIFDSTAVPTPRFIVPEDQSWARLDLARRAGYESENRNLTDKAIIAIFKRAVDRVWERIRFRLMQLSRVSVIERSLLNYLAMQKEHRDWHRTADAQLALYDDATAINIAKSRIANQDIVSLACRVITEMALSTSPYETGSKCTQIDLDFLIAEVATLLECANYCDAVHFRMVDIELGIHSNGSFRFDDPALRAVNSFLNEKNQRSFVESGNKLSEDSEEIYDLEALHTKFNKAFIVEFGLTIEQYTELVMLFTIEASSRQTAIVYLPKSQVLQYLQSLNIQSPDKFYEGLSIKPRSKWDEDNLEGATRKDWFPWRFNRRLSIIRRPLIQLSNDRNPLILVMPTLLAKTLEYLRTAPLGWLPERLFESPEMISFMGHASNQIGHQFNGKVARKLKELGWDTKQEVKLTELGGAEKLGDIDVLAWLPKSGLVFVIECKSLRFDRTYGEIGERLNQYVAGGRTALQKHLDRMSFLEGNRTKLSQITKISQKCMQLRSALVIEGLGPMKFMGQTKGKLDIVSEYRDLGEIFSKQ